MTVTMSLESRQRGLSEWWSEETEYIFQKIERWAAYARGYNRLRSQRISRGRMTMDEFLSSRWNISGNKIFIEEASWNPQVKTLNRSHARNTRPEELKLNCCGTLNYKSNGNLNSSCLETYSYDHSIYFKTIGDLKRKRNQNFCVQGLGNPNFEDQDSEEKVEWEQPKKKEEPNRFSQLIFIESFSDDDVEVEYSRTSAWSELDLSKLSIDQDNGNYNGDQNQYQHLDLCHYLNHGEKQVEEENEKFEFDENLVEDELEDENKNRSDSKYLKNSGHVRDSVDSKDSESQIKKKRFFSPRRKSNKMSISN